MNTDLARDLVSKVFYAVRNKETRPDLVDRMAALLFEGRFSAKAYQEYASILLAAERMRLDPVDVVASAVKRVLRRKGTASRSEVESFLEAALDYGNRQALEQTPL